MTTATWVVAAIAGAAFAYYFVLPWVPPLYARYKAWIAAKTK